MDVVGCLKAQDTRPGYIVAFVRLFQKKPRQEKESALDVAALHGIRLLMMKPNKSMYRFVFCK